MDTSGAVRDLTVRRDGNGHAQGIEADLLGQEGLALQVPLPFYEYRDTSADKAKSPLVLKVLLSTHQRLWLEQLNRAAKKAVFVRPSS